jgi:hypothetical protein
VIRSSKARNSASEIGSFSLSLVETFPVFSRARLADVVFLQACLTNSRCSRIAAKIVVSLIAASFVSTALQRGDVHSA